jgi:hypothetical protein
MNWVVFFGVLLIPAVIIGGRYLADLAIWLDGKLGWCWGGVIVFGLFFVGFAAIVGMLAA